MILRRLDSDCHNFGKGDTSKKYLWILNFHFAQEGGKLFIIEWEGIVSLLATVRGQMKRCVGENGEPCEDKLDAK